MNFTFLHVTDTHIGSSKDYTHRGSLPFANLVRLFHYLESIKLKYDLILHTGDMCGDKDNHASSECYELAKGCFSLCSAPVIHCAGNHDDPTLLRSFFSLPPHEVIYEDEDQIAYLKRYGEMNFLMLHSSIPSRRQGEIKEKQLKALDEVLRRGKNSFIVGIHHPVLPVASPWMDEHMLLEDGEKLHTIFSAHSSKILGVFHGHVHQAGSFCTEGVNYFSGGGTIFQFANFPHTSQCDVIEKGPICFSVVQVIDNRLHVKHCTVP